MFVLYASNQYKREKRARTFVNNYTVTNNTLPGDWSYVTGILTFGIITMGSHHIVCILHTHS